MNRRLSLIALALVALVGLSLIQASHAGAQGPSTLDQIKKNKVLRVGWATWHPYSFRDPKTQKLAGVTIDFIEEMATALGAKVEWVEDSWGTLPAGIQAGKFDITNLMAITPPRAQVVSFSDAVTKHDLSLLAPKNKAANAKSPKDFDKPGIKIGVTLGTNTDLYLTKAMTAAEIVRLRTPPEALLALTAGRVDAYASTVDSLIVIQKEHPSLGLVPGSFGSSDVAFAVRLNDQPMVEWLNKFIKEQKRAGKIRQLIGRHGLDASFAAD